MAPSVLRVRIAQIAHTQRGICDDRDGYALRGERRANGPVLRMLTASIGLIVAGLVVGGCATTAPPGAPLNVSSATTAPSPSTVAVPSSPASATGGTASTTSAPITVAPPAVAIPPAAPQKCVAFVTGPRAGATGPVNLYVRSTVPDTDVSMTIHLGTTTQQLTAHTDSAGLAMQTLSPTPAGQTEEIVVKVGAAQCSATYPLK
jgi:cytoskeletal protein RodZ